MFSNESLKNLKRNLSKQAQKDETYSFTKEEFQMLLHRVTLDGARFGAFILYQIENNEMIKDGMAKIIKEVTGQDIDIDSTEEEVFEFISRLGNQEEVGTKIQEWSLASFLSKSSNFHTMMLFDEKEPRELIVAAKSFSEALVREVKDSGGFENISSSLN